MDKLEVLRGKAVDAMSGIGRSKRYQLMKLGLFPKPIKLSGRSSGWLFSEVSAWIVQRVEERDAKCDSKPIIVCPSQKPLRKVVNVKLA